MIEFWNGAKDQMLYSKMLKMGLWLQKFTLIQPRTNLGKILEIVCSNRPAPQWHMSHRRTIHESRVASNSQSHPLFWTDHTQLSIVSLCAIILLSIFIFVYICCSSSKKKSRGHSGSRSVLDISAFLLRNGRWR